jgi:hypothetical protein
MEKMDPMAREDALALLALLAPRDLQEILVSVVLSDQPVLTAPPAHRVLLGLPAPLSK